jgi:hypothetical protein
MAASSKMTEVEKRAKRAAYMRQWNRSLAGKAYHARSKKRKAAYAKTWRALNLERILAREKAYQQSDVGRQKSAERQCAYRERHPDQAAAAQRRYVESDGGKRNREKSMRFYYRNRKKQLARRRAWEKANPEKHAAEQLRWQKRRGERDPTWRMMRNISRHIAGVLNGEKRGRRTTDLLGYTKS